MKRFSPLDLQYDTAVGIKLPLIYSDITSFTLTYTTLDQAKTNFKMLILTNEGERIMQPEFGCSLYKFLFDNDLEAIAEKVKVQIETKTSVWLPYINIKKMNHNFEDDHTINFDITWSLIYDDDTNEILTFKLSLT